jgi:hypothetical protein
MGVFGTRSPHRPCPIGLTVAKVRLTCWPCGIFWHALRIDRVFYCYLDWYHYALMDDIIQFRHQQTTTKAPFPVLIFTDNNKKWRMHFTHFLKCISHPYSLHHNGSMQPFIHGMVKGNFKIWSVLKANSPLMSSYYASISEYFIVLSLLPSPSDA